MGTMDIILIILVGTMALVTIGFVLHYMADKAAQRRIIVVGKIAAIIRREVTKGVVESMDTCLKGYAEIADKF